MTGGTPQLFAGLQGCAIDFIDAPRPVGLVALYTAHHR
jgi:hypothetical protein